MLDPVSIELLKKEYDCPFHQIPLDKDRRTYENAGCSDTIQIYVKPLSCQRLEVYFAGEGCQLSLASASLMCRLNHKKKLEETLQLLKKVQDTLKYGSPTELPKELSYLPAFYYKPNRRHCILLAWESLEKELHLSLGNFAIKRSLS